MVAAGYTVPTATEFSARQRVCHRYATCGYTGPSMRRFLPAQPWAGVCYRGPGPCSVLPFRFIHLHANRKNSNTQSYGSGGQFTAREYHLSFLIATSIHGTDYRDSLKSGLEVPCSFSGKGRNRVPGPCNNHTQSMEREHADEKSRNHSLPADRGHVPRHHGFQGRHPGNAGL